MGTNGILDNKTNGILDIGKKPLTRWSCSDVDQETVKMILGERLRFPYASNVIAPNRIMKSAMSEQLATYHKNDMKKSGIPTRELINLYEKFADGGFGTIVTGCIMINGKDIEAPGNVIIDMESDSDERRNAFMEWTECAKRSGSIIIAQLFHPGKCAADLPHKTDFDINKLTRKQIGELINDYAYAARYAQQCGFNGVEISCTSLFALGQLITSGENTRDDEFGGELDNRAKILFKIIQAIRMKISKPSRFVIGLKLFCDNFEPDYNSDTFGEFIHNVEKTGFDYIAITGGDYNLIKDLKRDDESNKCEYFYQNFVITMRKHLTRTKLFMSGGFVTLTDMVAAVHNGWAAGISLARPVAAEPDLPKRLFAGEVKSATKSLFDPADYSIEVKFAGSQLWQHGYLLTVMDASNPDHIEQFMKDLDFHEKQKLVTSNNEELVVGYPKTVVNPELLDEDMLKRIQQPSKEIISTGAVILDGHTAGDELTTKRDDMERELIEEEMHHVIKKQLDYGAPGDLQENIVEDSFRTVVKEHENLPDVGVDIIEETIEKVILTQSNFSEPPQSDFSEPPQSESIESPMQKAQTDAIETLNTNFNDAKTVLEPALEEDMKVVDEVIKDITEGLRKENEVNTQAVADRDEQYMETLSPTQQSEIKETAEVISGFSDDDRPIISGIVEEVSNAADDTIKPMEHAAEQENAESPTTENGKYPMIEREPPVGSENYDVDENAVEEVMRKEIYGVSTQMTTSFMEDSITHQNELSPGKGDEEFANALEFQDTEGNHEITGITEKDQQDHLQDYSEEDMIEPHAPEGVTEAYIPKDITEDYISKRMDEHFLERTDGTNTSRDLTDDYFHDDNMDNGIKDDLRSEATISKDMATDDLVQEYPMVKDYKNQHPEGFLEGEVNQRGLDELSGEVDHSSVSSTTYSTLMGGNGESVFYKDYYDSVRKYSVPSQSPKETYHSEIYEIPSAESKDIKSAENLSGEKVDTSQVQQEFDTDKSLTDSSTTHRHGLTGFISDSVQNLITSTKNKFDEMLSESDKKHQPDLQFTMKTNEVTEDDGRKYEVYTESYTVSNADHRSSSDFGDTKAFSTDDSDKFKVHDDDLTSGSTDTQHSTETIITTMTNQDEKESIKHQDGLFGDKKSTDELDFEFIH
ncbi:unnamed protein product [Cercopithifilaria johnstoni]|uniref:NADH:flavin oxidoreductase/NADH oxidase N-terminal domain-containing protein n=1 Tax=Cercopithifilaria johnstoni TaxID=2874296 RepID=A0A8J2M1E3_9BILA|nr:unnamed protein product [Cercopithifilaria johnstoni]